MEFQEGIGFGGGQVQDCSAVLHNRGPSITTDIVKAHGGSIPISSKDSAGTIISIQLFRHFSHHNYK